MAQTIQDSILSPDFFRLHRQLAQDLTSIHDVKIGTILRSPLNSRLVSRCGAFLPIPPFKTRAKKFGILLQTPTCIRSSINLVDNMGSSRGCVIEPVKLRRG